MMRILNGRITIRETLDIKVDKGIERKRDKLQKREWDRELEGESVRGNSAEVEISANTQREINGEGIAKKWWNCCVFPKSNERETERDRERDRQTVRQTEKDRDGETKTKNQRDKYVEVGREKE